MEKEDEISKKTKINSELAKKIKQWHDIRPDVILINAAGAVNPSVVLKQAWKIAYSNEKIPYFLIVDPRRFGADKIRRNFNDWYYKMGPGEAEKRAYAEIENGKGYIGDIIRKISRVLTGRDNAENEIYDRRILVFDECSTSMPRDFPINYMDEYHYKKKDPFGSPLAVAFSLAQNSSFNDIWVDGGAYGELLYRTLPNYAADIPSVSQLFTRSFKEPKKFNRMKGKAGKKVIAQLKQIGTMIGEEVRREKVLKQKSLERRVVVASIISLILSILFISGISGSVIGQRNSELPGLLFIILWLILGIYFIYLRSSKKN